MPCTDPTNMGQEVVNNLSPDEKLERDQPWKAFCDPNVPASGHDLPAGVVGQKTAGVPRAELVVYSAENERD